MGIGFHIRNFRLSRALSVLCFAAIVSSGHPLLLSAESVETQGYGWEVIKSQGQARLLSVKGQKVLLLKGTPYEMGFQHGKLLAREIAENAEAYLNDKAVDKAGQALSELAEIFESLRPHIPAIYMEEMKGLADGSGVSLEKIHLLHALPSRFHCTGSAAFGKATEDGKLYHTRSLDYSLDIGDRKTVQENAAVIVFQPNEGNAHAVVSWAGLIGCVSGMNDQGISIGEIGNSCRDESYAGMPMVFMLREALRRSKTQDDVVTFIRKSPRTCGFTFVVGDGKVPTACAIEVSHSRMAVAEAGDPKCSPPPHSPIAGVIRRGNYFIDKEMAAIQRRVYDPRISSPVNWLGYSVMSSFFVENHGKINGAKMIQLLRKYPAGHSCLHQVVFCPSDLEFWVSNAVSPRTTEFAGAQNQAFYRYSLSKLIQGVPFEVEVAAPPDKKAGGLPSPETGSVRVSEKDESVSAGSLSRFRLKEREFPWVLAYEQAREKYFVASLSFPSQVETRWAEANTVFAEYYLPRRPGKAPTVIVLDILNGSFVVARTVSKMLAEGGVAALAVHAPFFGKRRPRDDSAAGMFAGDVAFTRDLIAQAVVDIRCAAEWLRAREEVDSDKTGIVGVSLGAILGGLTIGIDKSFTRNALVVGGGDLAQIIWTSPDTAEYKERLQSDGYTLEKLRQELQPVDPLTYADRIDPSRVMLFNARKDRTIINECTLKFWEKAGKPRIIWYNTSHTGISLYISAIIKEIRGFIQG